MNNIDIKFNQLKTDFNRGLLNNEFFYDYGFYFVLNNDSVCSNIRDIFFLTRK